MTKIGLFIGMLIVSPFGDKIGILEENSLIFQLQVRFHVHQKLI